MGQVHVKLDNVRALLWLRQARVKRCDQVISHLAASVEQGLKIVAPVNLDVEAELRVKLLRDLVSKLVLLRVVLDDDLGDVFPLGADRSLRLTRRLHRYVNCIDPALQLELVTAIHVVAPASGVQYESMAIFLTLGHVLQEDVVDFDGADVPLAVRLVLPRVHVVIVHCVELEQRWQLILAQHVVIPDVLLNAQRSARN